MREYLLARFCLLGVLASASLLLWTKAAAGETFWVRPTGQVQGGGDGRSYATAFGGFRGILWGAGEGRVGPGDRLYVCGRHRETFAPLVGGSPGAEVSFSGECPGGTAGRVEVVGTTGILLRRPHVRVGGGLVVASAGGAGVEIRADHVSVGDITVHGSRFGIAISNGVRNVSLSGCTVRDNELVGIYLNETAVGKVYRDLSIVGCSVIGNGNHGIRIWFVEEAGRASYLDGLLLQDNVVTGNGGDGVVVIHAAVNELRPEPVMRRVKIVRNKVMRNSGGIALRGVTSTARAWGENVIEENVCSQNQGVTGGIDIFWSQYVDIARNNCSENSSVAEDGNGILVDHGNRHIRVRWNRVDRNGGSPGTLASGVGVMVLDSQDVDVYGNMGTGNKVGLWFAGAPGSSANVRVFNNSFMACAAVGVWIGRVVERGSVSLLNNLVGAPIGVVAERGGQPQVEDHNYFVGDRAYELNGVFAPGAMSRGVAGIGRVEGDGRRVSELCGKGKWLGEYEDFEGRRYKKSPAIGALECR